MDKRINKKTETYVSDFKNSICEKIKKNEDVNTIIEYIYEYPRLNFDKDDFVKRKRLRNTVPTTNRCTAKRANGEQCTRRKKENCDFCGTHFKNAPHGLMSSANTKQKKIEVFTKDIKGIWYWIDNEGNIYKTDDILKNIENPKIIGSYKIKNDDYSINEFFN